MLICKIQTGNNRIVNSFFGIIVERRRLRNVECTFYSHWENLTYSRHETI